MNEGGGRRAQWANRQHLGNWPFFAKTQNSDARIFWRKKCLRQHCGKTNHSGFFTPSLNFRIRYEWLERQYHKILTGTGLTSLSPSLDVGEGTNDGWTKVPPMGHFFVGIIFKLLQTKDQSVKTKKLPWE